MKICVICGKIKHLSLITNNNEKGNNPESHQLRHHRPHCRPQLLLCAELQVIASEHELHESNESYLFKGHIRAIRDIRVQLNICSSTENSCHSRNSCSVKPFKIHRIQ